MDNGEITYFLFKYTLFTKTSISVIPTLQTLYLRHNPQILGPQTPALLLLFFLCIGSILTTFRSLTFQLTCSEDAYAGIANARAEDTGSTRSSPGRFPCWGAFPARVPTAHPPQGSHQSEGRAPQGKGAPLMLEKARAQQPK